MVEGFGTDTIRAHDQAEIARLLSDNARLRELLEYAMNREPGHPTLKELEQMQEELDGGRSFSLDQAVAMTK